MNACLRILLQKETSIFINKTSFLNHQYSSNDHLSFNSKIDRKNKSRSLQKKLPLISKMKPLCWISSNFKMMFLENSQLSPAFKQRQLTQSSHITCKTFAKVRQQLYERLGVRPAEALASNVKHTLFKDDKLEYPEHLARYLANRTLTTIES